jgi:tetratricopeptide (TPR) repeat protein
MPYAVLLLLCVIAAGFFGVRAAFRETLEAKRELLAANSNTRQLLQQVYELANRYIDDLPDPTTLTEEQRNLLSTWVACDESFLRLNPDSRNLLLERSLVARRAGTIRGLFGEYDRATKHLNDSLSILEQLGDDQSNRFSHQLLLIECHGLLAWTNANDKRFQDAVQSCRNAAEVLDRLNLPDSAEGDLSLVNSTQQVTQASLGLGALELAYLFGQAEFEARSRLSERAPGDPVALERLQESKNFLERVRSQAGSTNAF